MPDRESLLLRGVLDLCVLALLDREPVHGYEIAGRLGEHGLPAAAGSIYPLLARLEKQGLIAAETVPSVSGPPRRSWRTLPAGREELAAGRATWRRMAGAIEVTLGAAEPSETRSG